MRIREFILGKPESGPSALNRTTQIDIMHAYNALFSTIGHILTRISRINYLTESRTSDTQILCAIASARRLCGQNQQGG
jgi:hypothetical protein